MARLTQLAEHEPCLAVLQGDLCQSAADDAPFVVQQIGERRRALSGLDFLPPIDQDELPIQQLPYRVYVVVS